MDECEFLCNRLAIMADGKIRCIGPIQNLKNSFGLGFVIHIVYNERTSIDNSQNILNVKDSMSKLFNQCKLQEEYAVRLLTKQIHNIFSNKIKYLIDLGSTHIHRERRIIALVRGFCENSNFAKAISTFCN